MKWRRNGGIKNIVISGVMAKALNHGMAAEISREIMSAESCEISGIWQWRLEISAGGWPQPQSAMALMPSAFLAGVILAEAKSVAGSR
jgi:hypothetical protein